MSTSPMVNDLVASVHWSEQDLARLGVVVNPSLVDKALKGYWNNYLHGLAGHAKVHLTLSAGPPRCTEGALVGYYDKYSGVKDLHRGHTNPAIGRAASVEVILRDKQSGKRYMSLEGRAISNGRTGWFAVACLNLLLKGKQDIEVYLFGAGALAEAVILTLNFGAPTRIKRIAVLSRSGRSNHMLVEKLSSQVQFVLEAVDDRLLLPKASFVITATNAGVPLFGVDDIAPNAVVLSLGLDDLPPEYFDRLFAMGGLVIGDDMDMMEKRNANPVALYYSRRGKKLTVEGRKDGVRGYAEVLSDPQLMKKLETWNGPATLMPVGLASLDIAVAACVYETLLERLTSVVSPKPLPTISLSIPNRIARLKAGMELNGIDVLVCFKPENSFYLTAFNPSIYSHPVIGILMKNHAKPILLVNGLREKNAKSTPGDRIVYTYSSWFGADTMGETWQQAIKNILADGGQNIGIEGEITAFQRDELARILPGATFSYANDLIQGCRNVKDADEIVNACIAAEICNAGMAAAEMSLIGVGTEQHAVRAAWNAMYDLWATKYSECNINGFGSLEGGDFYGFKPWVLAGRRRFLRVDKPTADPICDDAVGVLIWACINGMHAELERTIFIGNVSDAQREALARITVIRDEIFAMLRPGVPLNELYKTACARLTEHGHTLPRRIGHGIGLGAHEHLSIDQHTCIETTPGMILTVEPIIDIPEQNISTQFSDTVVITETGYKFLAPYVGFTLGGTI